MASTKEMQRRAKAHKASVKFYKSLTPNAKAVDDLGVSIVCKMNAAFRAVPISNPNCGDLRKKAVGVVVVKEAPSLAAALIKMNPNLDYDDALSLSFRSLIEMFKNQFSS